MRHRLQNDLCGAIDDAGRMVLRLEYNNVCTHRHGPREGQINHEVMGSAAQEYFTVSDTTKSLSQLLFEDVAASSPMRLPTHLSWAPLAAWG